MRGSSRGFSESSKKFFRNRIITWKRARPPKSGFGARSEAAVEEFYSLSYFLANRDDVIGDKPRFTGNDQPHRNAFRFVVVAAMQQVHDSNSRAKT
jgi:hypothetical protein